MTVDPAAGFALDQTGRSAERLNDLERRLAALERGSPTVQTGAGVPSSSPRSGTPYVDETTPRLYLRVAGVWRYTTLT